MQVKKSYIQLVGGSVFFLILICTVLLYWRGLPSPYLLDDEPNLEELSHIGKGNLLDDIALFISKGNAGPSGRPISLLSFALQAHNWPGNPRSFKYVNLMLHLFNGCLIFWFILCLTRLMALPEKRGLLLALLTSFLWLTNPLHVSTVLYVIQRMAQLSAFFTLAGLLAYVHGRQLVQTNPVKGFVWVSAGIGLGGILAVLSKENGVLLVLYILVLEATLLNALAKPRYWRIWAGLFLYLPALGLFAYLLIKYGRYALGDRPITEARILVEYLYNILVPRLHALSLFHDDYVVSRGLFSPPATFIAICFILTLLITAFWLRRRYRVFSLAVLWFFAGHVLESTIIPLVFYFEHRNYLPMLGILFGVVYGMLYLFDHMRTNYLRKTVIACCGLWFFLFPMFTWTQTGLWSRPVLQAVLWAEQKPLSRYAQSQAAAIFAQLGELDEAVKIYKHMVTAFPQDTGSYMLWLGVACNNPESEFPNIEKVRRHFQSSRGDTAAGKGTEIFVKAYLSGKCPRLSAEIVETLLETLHQNANFSPVYKLAFYSAYARFLAHKKRYAEAIILADKALAIQKNDGARMSRLSWLLISGRADEALAYIRQLHGELDVVALRYYSAHLNAMEKEAHKLKMRRERNAE